jgi:hypothetical protein
MPDGTTSTTTTTTTQPWYSGVQGIDQEIVGHWTNAGWANKKPEEIAVEATKSWKAAERHVGAPADQIVRLPKELSDEKGWDAVWKRLGKPAEAKGYDFSAIKFADGSALEEGFQNTMREVAYKLNLPKDAATAIAAEFAKYLDGAETSENAERTAKLAEQKAALKKNWGPNEAANMFVAQRSAAALGVTPADIAALESVIGYDRVMEMFRTIGTKIGEDKFIQGTNKGTGNAPMTRDEAVARKADLMSDKVWATAFLAGDKAKAREMEALNIIITGIAAAA